MSYSEKMSVALCLLLPSGCGDAPPGQKSVPTPAAASPVAPVEVRAAPAEVRSAPATTSPFDRLPDAPPDLEPIAEYQPDDAQRVPRDDLGLPLVLEIEPPEVPPEIDTPAKP